MKNRWKIVALIFAFALAAGSGAEPEFWRGAPKFFALITIGLVLLADIFEF